MDHKRSTKTLFIVLEETTKLSSKGSIPFCIPTSNEWEYVLLHFLTSTWRCDSNRCVVLSPSCFSLHLLDDPWCGMFFHVLVCFLNIFFGAVSLRVFGLFKKKLGYFLNVKIEEFIAYFVPQSFNRCVFWKYFLSGCGLCSHSLENFHFLLYTF